MGFAVIAFNFLRPPLPVWAQRLQQICMPAQSAQAFFVMGASLAIVAGVMLIEHERLERAQAAEAAYRLRFERSTVALKEARLCYDRVRSLMALQQKLTNVSESGDVQALRLARIANAVPAHAWLTSLTERDRSIAVEGGTASLETLADALRGLTMVQGVTASTLTHVRSNTHGATVLSYGMAMDVAEQ